MVLPEETWRISSPRFRTHSKISETKNKPPHECEADFIAADLFCLIDAFDVFPGLRV